MRVIIYKKIAVTKGVYELSKDRISQETGENGIQSIIRTAKNAEIDKAYLIK